jgi:outer membrane protein assembly factor BamB
MAHPQQVAARVTRNLLAVASLLLPGCDITASMDAQESIAGTTTYGKIGAGTQSTEDFGDRLGPTQSLWTDAVSLRAAPLSILQQGKPLLGAPPLGPDVVIGGLGVYANQSGKVMAVDLASRAVKWMTDTPWQSGWIASDGKVVCGPEPSVGALTCLELADGKVRFHTAMPPAAGVTEFALTSGVALVLDSQARLRAVDLGTGALLYQHVVVATNQRSFFPVGTDLVLALSKGCDGAPQYGCLASVDPKTGVSRGQWPQPGSLLWRDGGKALFVSRDATYQRTIVAMDEASHQFSDVSSTYASLLAEFNSTNLDFTQVAGPTTDGAVYLDGRVFSSGGGKLCRFEAATQKKTWCIDGQDLKIRLHPNALYAWSSVPGTYPGVFSPSTGAALASQNGFSLFFGKWGFGDGKMLEVH